MLCRPANTLNESVAVQDGVGDALGRHSQVLIQSTNQELADLACPHRSRRDKEPGLEARSMGSSSSRAADPKSARGNEKNEHSNAHVNSEQSWQRDSIPPFTSEFSRIRGRGVLRLLHLIGDMIDCHVECNFKRAIRFCCFG